MAIDKTQLLADLRIMIADDPITIVHKTKSLTALKSANRSGKSFDDQGITNDLLEFSIVAPVTDFTTVPDKGHDITVAGTRYNISQVDLAHCGVAYRIYLGFSYNAEVS